MVIGGIIAMLFIFGLFLSMLASPPRPDEEAEPDTAPVTK